MFIKELHKNTNKIELPCGESLWEALSNLSCIAIDWDGLQILVVIGMKMNFLIFHLISPPHGKLSGGRWLRPPQLHQGSVFMRHKPLCNLCIWQWHILILRRMTRDRPHIIKYFLHWKGLRTMMVCSLWLRTRWWSRA